MRVVDPRHEEPDRAQSTNTPAAMQAYPTMTIPAVIAHQFTFRCGSEGIVTVISRILRKTATGVCLARFELWCRPEKGRADRDRALKDAVSDALIPRNVARARAPRPTKPEIHPLSQDQARKLLATALETNDRFEALYVLALHCGLRESELFGLKWDDIDPSGATEMLHVRRTLTQTRTGYILEEPKTGKGRSVKCSLKATEAPKRRRSRQNQKTLPQAPSGRTTTSSSRPTPAPRRAAPTSSAATSSPS